MRDNGQQIERFRRDRVRSDQALFDLVRVKPISLKQVAAASKKARGELHGTRIKARARCKVVDFLPMNHRPRAAVRAARQDRMASAGSSKGQGLVELWTGPQQ